MNPMVKLAYESARMITTYMSDRGYGTTEIKRRGRNCTASIHSKGTIAAIINVWASARRWPDVILYGSYISKKDKRTRDAGYKKIDISEDGLESVLKYIHELEHMRNAPGLA